MSKLNRVFLRFDTVCSLLYGDIMILRFTWNTFRYNESYYIDYR